MKNEDFTIKRFIATVSAGPAAAIVTNSIPSSDK
jgi:hypothetical protein